MTLEQAMTAAQTAEIEHEDETSARFAGFLGVCLLTLGGLCGYRVYAQDIAPKLQAAHSAACTAQFVSAAAAAEISPSYLQPGAATLVSANATTCTARINGLKGVLTWTMPPTADPLAAQAPTILSIPHPAR